MPTGLIHPHHVSAKRPRPGRREIGRQTKRRGRNYPAAPQDVSAVASGRGEHIADHVLQNAAVLVVVELVERIDPAQ